VKRNLGNLFAVLLATFSTLYGEIFTYSLQADRNKTVLHAPVHIDVDLNQTDPTYVVLFEFAPQKSDAYEIVQIDALHDDTPHHTHHHYRYELYPLKTGDIKVRFKLVKRVTDDRKMAFSASGDRDDYKKLETIDTPVALPPLQLHVDALQKAVRLTGDFTLTYRFDKTQGEAFEPLPVTVLVKGKGYPPLLRTIFTTPPNVTRFAQKPEIKRILTPQGILYEARYALAFSAPTSFTLPAVSLRAYNPDKKRFYTLDIPRQHFDITPVNKQKLLDKTDAPPPLKHPTNTLFAWTGYLGAFLAGMATLYVWQRRPRRRTQKKRPSSPLEEAIDAADDIRALRQVLLAHDAKRFAPLIEAMRHDKNAALSKYKAKAKELV
jgi:hypothetical protein